MITKNISRALIIFSSLAVAILPLSANALSVSSNNDIEFGAHIKTPFSEVENNASGHINAIAESHIQSNAVSAHNDKDVKEQEKSDKKSEDKDKNENSAKVKNNNEVKINNGWFSRFFNFFFKTDGVIKISAVTEKETATTTTLGWYTNKETKSKVYFSTDISLLTATSTGASVVVDNSLTLQHTATISSLLPHTKYFYVIEYTDANNVTARTPVGSFGTKSTTSVDTVPPEILFSTVLDLTGTGTRIVWVTSERANSKVWLSSTSGVNTSSAPTKVSGSMSTFHDITVSGLATSTHYYYVTGSADAQGNVTIGTEHSFTTNAN